ncbi:dTDP-4-dehydrorhamnose 3,5-epimerase [Candidatus Binatia bacterium]|nr:dTDP-4-dehydrorhamnose 3,5-epimerase [Candidatus Binatia bacterium]
MKFIPTALPEVIVVEPDVFRDPRGFFLETYHAQKYRDGGIAATFVQDNHSRSVRGTLRGLHAQIGSPQGKLVRVLQGEVYDVAVDVRRGSPTFGRWVAVTLSAENFRQCYIPVGFVHGFCVTSEVAEVEYKVTNLYDPASEITVIWNDPAIGIPWPIAEPVLSVKDARGLPLAELNDRLPVYCG